MSPRWPNLLIVGAPRCGTTALYEYLRAHPLVYMSPTKELHYFGRDLDGRRFVRDTKRYLDHFAGATGEVYVGEGSIFSLVSRTAAREIRDAVPDARILVMLRDPVDFIHSLHAKLLWTGGEDIADLSEALDAEVDRRQGRRIPPTAHFAKGLEYREMASFADQLDRFVDAFGDAVHVMLLEDVRADPATTLRGLLAFLGLPDEFDPVFPQVNENTAARRPTLHKLVKRVTSGRMAERARRWVPAGVATRLERAVDAAITLNTRPVHREPMPPELRARLVSELAPQVQRLEVLLGRDLSHWLVTDARMR